MWNPLSRDYLDFEVPLHCYLSNWMGHSNIQIGQLVEDIFPWCLAWKNNVFIDHVPIIFPPLHIPTYAKYISLLPLSLPRQLKSVAYNWHDLIILSIEVADALAFVPCQFRACIFCDSTLNMKGGSFWSALQNDAVMVPFSGYDSLLKSGLMSLPIFNVAGWFRNGRRAFILRSRKNSFIVGYFV